MYGVNQLVSQSSSHDEDGSNPSQNEALSLELREVLHMLDAIEQNATEGNSSR